MTHGDVCAGLLGQPAGTPVVERWARHEVPEGSIAELAFDAGRLTVVTPAHVPVRSR